MIMKMLKLCMIRLNAIACIIMIIIIRSNCQYLRSNNTNSTSAVRLLSATVTDDMKKKPGTPFITYNIINSHNHFKNFF